MKIVPGAHYKAKNGNCFFDFGLSIDGYFEAKSSINAKFRDCGLSIDGYFEAKSSINAKFRDCGCWHEDGTFYDPRHLNLNLVQRINADGSDYVECPIKTGGVTNINGVECNEFGVPNDGFKVGDKVWSPMTGNGVVSRDDEDLDYPIEVESNDSHSLFERFRVTGKYENTHPCPSLRLVRRPKKKVTKELVRWVVLDPEIEQIFVSCRSFGDAQAFRTGKQIIVELRGTYETEEN